MATETPAGSAAPIERHPDIAEMRMRYERAAETPRAQMVDGLIVLTGLYLAMSPWVIGFNAATALTATDLISGIAFALLGVGFAAAYGRTHGIAWAAPVIGLWAIFAPWLISGPTVSAGAWLSNVIAGILCLLFGLGAMSAGGTMMPMRSQRT
jgi:hypothetical protein